MKKYIADQYRDCVRRVLATTIAVALLLTFFFTQSIEFAVRADTNVSVSLTALSLSYTQSFDTLASSSTGTLAANTPDGWGFVETGANANTIYTAGTGSGTAGDTYSFGAAAGTDRAFGQIDSNSLSSRLGAVFTNNTGSTVTSLDIAYTGEQWRSGDTANVADVLDFEYSTDATSLTTGTWTAVNELDFTSLQTTATAGALDGNAAANRAARSHSVTGLSIPNGATFWIRWVSANIGGNDDGLAIDDFSITPQGGSPVDNPPTVAATAPADNANNIAVNANVSVTFSEPVTATGSSFQINCATSGAHPFALTGGATTYTLDPATDFTQGEVCTVTVFAAQVADQDGTPNNLAQDYVFKFTVINTAPVAIHDIQGAGATSPLVGQTVTTNGIVTLLKTGTNNGGAASSFFLQAPDAGADADPNTSEGILVFTSTIPTVAVGDAVSVTGTVVEFNGMTEISPVSSISIISSGNALPTPITLTSAILDPTAAPAQPQLEKYEGMRLSAASLTTVAPNDGFYDVYTVITGVPRPLREPGIPISLAVPPDPTTGVPDCCIPRWDQNPERLLVDTNARAGAPLNPYTSNVAFTNVAGLLDFAFGQYRFIPDAALNASANMSAVPVPAPAADEFTVGGFNVENFNNNAVQRQKAALTIRDVLRLPDIVGMIEIFELSGLQALAAEVNTISPGVNYQAYLVEADGTAGDADQDVAFLVNTARVQVNSVTQRNATETFVNPNNGQSEILNDRPPLVLNATIQPSGANVPVIVVVNHLRSFIDIDQDPGEGARVRAKRKAQAESLARLLQELQTNNPATSIVSVGDYNAYQFSDGYTDPVATIKGNPTPDDQIVVDQSPDLVNPDFFNLVDKLPISERYSFIFEGTPQALDQVLVNTVANARNTRIAAARVNADFPEVPAAAYAANAARPERNSDHDPLVSYFSLTAAPGSSSVTGTITYGTTPLNESAKPVPNVVVTATGTTTESDATDGAGFYQLNNLTPGGTYTVTPAKSGDVNGITPFDATLVLRCVAAGANCQLTANQRLAADTNNNGSITPFDATLILRFVAANGATANTGNTGTWRFQPPARMYSPLTGSQTNQDYTAILVGEVSGSWMAPPSAP